jgi:hypothetical protein
MHAGAMTASCLLVVGAHSFSSMQSLCRRQLPASDCSCTASHGQQTTSCMTALRRSPRFLARLTGALSRLFADFAQDRVLPIRSHLLSVAQHLAMRTVLIDSAIDDSSSPPWPDSKRQHVRRWKRIDSSIYNSPRAEEPEAYRRGSYMPQYNVVHAHAHHADESQETQAKVQEGKKSDHQEVFSMDVPTGAGPSASTD